MQQNNAVIAAAVLAAAAVDPVVGRTQRQHDLRLRVADLRVMGRNTQGVRLINLEKKNDEIASVCKVQSQPEPVEDAESETLDADTTTNNE